LKVKLDENMPCDLEVALSFVDDVDTVGSEGLSGASDDEVWQAAQREHRFLVTQDLDFSDLRKFAPGTHAGLLLLRISNPSRRRLNERLHDLFRFEDVESWRGCFVVATDSKVRVREPQ
jgi:predicted nuclease of predicted toxin-antitoxin system